jgi:hypothetical protein
MLALIIQPDPGQDFEEMMMVGPAVFRKAAPVCSPCTSVTASIGALRLPRIKGRGLNGLRASYNHEAA